MLPITKYGQEKEQIEQLLKDIVTTLTTLILRYIYLIELLSISHIS